MGAAPERFGQQAARSPLHERREVEFHTETITAYSGKPGPRKFTRVPTHAIGVAEERRRYPRARLALPLRLTRIGAVPEPIPVTLVTRNISSSGIYFLAPRDILPGTAIELEVALVERPVGFGTVQMCTAAHVVRAEACDMPGWRGYAATFDDFALRRDDVIPMRFHSK
jgi:PilZ domain